MTTSSKSDANATPDGEASESIDRKLLAHHEERITQLLAILAKAPKSGNKRLILEASLTAAEASRTDILKAIRAKEEPTGNLADHVAIEPLFEPPDLDDPEWMAAMDSLGAKPPEGRAENPVRAEPPPVQSSSLPDVASRPDQDTGDADERKAAEAEIAASIQPQDIAFDNLSRRISQWADTTHGCTRELLARYGNYAGDIVRLSIAQRRALLVEILVDLGQAPLPEPEPLPPPPKPRSRPRPASRIAESGPPRPEFAGCPDYEPYAWPEPREPRRTWLAQVGHSES